MTTARDLPDAIQWHEGMLLAPQHFQQWSQRLDAVLHYHASMVAPYHWGVRHLRIDEVMLVDGTFRVLELEAVMPDGLVVTHPNGAGGDLTVDLAPHAERMKQRPLKVHLAVTALRPGLPPVAGELARYDSVEGAAVADSNTGEGEMRIPRLRPRLRLLTDDTPPQKFVAFPLAELAYGNETFEQTAYVPPTLRVAVASPLGILCSGIAKRLREKAIFLSEQVRSPSSATRVPQLLEKKMMVHALVAALPRFEAVLNTGLAHPYALYLALCALVGHVATIGHALVPPVPEPYDHDDLRLGFDQARRYLWQTLDEGISETYTGFPFYLEDGSFFLAFDPAWRDRDLILGVRAKDGISEQETVRWVEQSLIGSRPKISSMWAKRVRGAARRPLGSAADLVPARGVTLFALDNDPEFIVPGELLEVRNLDDPAEARRPLEIVLYLKNPA